MCGSSQSPRFTNPCARRRLKQTNLSKKSTRAAMNLKTHRPRSGSSDLDFLRKAARLACECQLFECAPEQDRLHSDNDQFGSALGAGCRSICFGRYVRGHLFSSSEVT